MCALLQGQHARTQLSPPRSPPETRQVDRGGQSLADRPQGRSRLLEKLGIDLPKLGRQMKGDPRRQCGVEVKGTDFAVRQWCEPCVSLSCVTLGKLLNLSDLLVHEDRSAHVGCLVHGQRERPRPGCGCCFSQYSYYIIRASQVVQ